MFLVILFLISPIQLWAQNSVSGTITVGGVGLQGVTVTSTGAVNTSVTTNASGQFTITGFGNGNRTATLTPSLAGYTFTPASITFTNNFSNTPHLTGRNFTATPTNVTLTVNTSGSGTIHVNGNPYNTPVVVSNGSTVNLSATPNSGWQFVGWTGDLTSANANSTLLMNSNKTITATFEPIGTPGSTLRLLYKNNKTSATSQTLEPHMILVNDSPNNLNFTNITIRYWFTSEPPGIDQYVTDYALVGNAAVTGSFGAINGNRYLQIGFTSAATIPNWVPGGGTPNLFPAGLNSGEIQARVHDDGWANYNQANDYSWDPTFTSFNDYQNITVYYQGALVWGTPPAGAAEAEQMTVTTQPVNSTAGSLLTQSPVVRLLDALGNGVAGIDVTATINKNNFAGGSTVIVTTDANGYATFNNLKLNVADTDYQITFDADAPLVSNQVSDMFNVSAASPTLISINTQPSNTVAGQSITPSPKVLLTDQYGNPVPGIQVTATLNQNSFASGTTQVTTNSSGIADFTNLVITTAATGYRINFSIADVGVEVAQSAAFTVSAAAASALTVTTQPTESVAGNPISGPPTVRLTDAYGNPVSGINITVSETGNYTFDAGTLVRATNASGFAIFNDLVINTAGEDYQLEFDADASGVSNVTSDMFDVTNAGGTLSITQQPTNTVAGQTISPAPAVTLIDYDDNPVPDVEITISLSENAFASGTLTVTTDANGVAVFNNLVINTANDDYQITFSADLTGVANAISSVFEVTSAAASAISIITQPTSTTAGNVISGPPTAKISDAYGNPVSGVNLQVALNKHSFFSGTLTKSSNAMGIAEFDDLVIRKADSGFQITFSSPAPGVSSINSNNFVINPAAASHLTIVVQPANGTAGALLEPAPAVEVRDTYNNTVSGIDVTATLNKSNFTGGSTTIVTSTANGAVFSNLRINLVDTGYQITFSAPGLSNVTSSSFALTQPDPIFGDIRLQYRNNETATNAGSIQPFMRLYNDSDLNLNLSDITIRYWFTSEPPGNDVYVVDWAELGATSNFSGSFDDINGEYFIEISFSSSIVLPVGLGGDGATANLMPPGSTSGVIQQRIRDSAWQNYDQSNDYSFNASITSYTDYQYITVYYKGALVWGIQPEGVEGQLTYYSRISGNWSTASTWSTTAHGGSAAASAPGVDSEVIIGNNHTVTLTANVTNNASVTVNSTGTIATGAYILSGSGSFALGQNATIKIGSPQGLASSGNTGNIQVTGSRSFSDQANYEYNGSAHQITGSGLPEELNGNLIINNPVEVAASTSYIVNGTLTLAAGEFVLDHGQSLIANNKNLQGGELVYLLNITGSRGYRMISSPIAATIGNLFSGTLTQGFTGASISDPLSHQPNVLWYDETYEGTDNQRWRAPSNASNMVVPGRGYQVFVFGSITEDDRYNDPLPHTLRVNGLEHEPTSGYVDMNISYTPDGDEGWNLVGNPYGAAIDWEHSDWVKENIDASIYVWDANTNQFHVWNGITGDIPGGILAPFQGFWIKANAEAAQLKVGPGAKTIGGSFIGKLNPDADMIPKISIQAYHSDHLQSTVHFTFTEHARTGLDRHDARKLLPPQGIANYLEIYSRTSDGHRLAISNLPRNFGRTIRIPVELNGYQNGKAINENIRLSVGSFDNIPADWEVHLVDKQSGRSYNLRDMADIRPDLTLASTDSDNHITDHYIVTTSRDKHASMELVINPGRDAMDLPDDFKLHQNYPNPFNPTTTFRFAVPEESQIRIDVFDVLGRLVDTLVNASYQAGIHEVRWSASHLSSGVYIARLATPEGVQTIKLSLIK